MDVHGEFERPIDALCLFHRGTRYSGSGLLRWTPESGFSLVGCQLEAAGGRPPPKSAVIGMGPMIMEPSVIWMKSRSGPQFIAELYPHITVLDHTDTTMWKSFEFPSARAVERLRQHLSGQSAQFVFKLETRRLFPDPIETQLTLAGEDFRSGWSMSGLKIDSDAFTLRARYDDGHVTAYIRVGDQSGDADVAATTFQAYRRWGRALAVTFTALTTAPCQLVHSDIMLGTRRERWYERPLPTRQIISVPMIPGTHIDTGLFSTLLPFLARPSTESCVATKLISRVIVAHQLGYRESQELSIGTALEAAVRTLNGLGRKKLTQGQLKRLLQDLFNARSVEGWDDRIEEVWSAYVALRHRNAHPVWECDESRETRERAEQALADRNTLTTFFGQLIQLLAGIEVEPAVG